MTTIHAAIAELRDLDRQQREWRQSVRHRRISLITRRVPVAKRMRVLATELGMEPIEGETLEAFVARAAHR